MPRRAVATAPAPAPDIAAARTAVVTGERQAELEAVVEAVVSRHVTPLREQLNAYEDRLRWRDVLGGIGYILGLTGLAAAFSTHRRRQKMPPP